MRHARGLAAPALSLFFLPARPVGREDGGIARSLNGATENKCPASRIINSPLVGFPYGPQLPFMRSKCHPRLLHLLPLLRVHGGVDGSPCAVTIRICIPESPRQ